MRPLALILSLLSLAVAGCGGDDDGSAPATGTATQPAATTAPSSGDAVQIEMRNIAFEPAEATAKVGQKVVWTNEDEAPHNVIGGPLKSETFNKGGTYEFTPTEPGTIEYVCTIHPGMKGTLTVTDG